MEDNWRDVKTWSTETLKEALRKDIHRELAQEITEELKQRKQGEKVK